VFALSARHHHRVHALGDPLREVRGVRDGSDALGALGRGEGGEVDVGLCNPLADPLVLDGPPARAGHALLVRLVVVERKLAPGFSAT
jgi:hypothetical protein